VKKQFIKDLQAGDSIDDIFVLFEKSLSRKRDGSPFLNLVVSDKTGSMKAVMWEDVQPVSEQVNAGDFVRVKGMVNEYRGAPQLVIKEMAPRPGDGFDPVDFLPSTARDTDRMFERLKQITGSIESECLRRLIEAFWNDGEFVQQFKSAPAAKKMHHAYVGGLLEHTLSMSILVDRIAGHYGGVDRDLLLAGTMLHDVGKTREFEFTTRIDYSDEGRLLNHIVIGLQMIDERVRDIHPFPEELLFLLKHLVVSHHGSREFGSPEPPKTIEAVLLNYIDEIDAKVSGIRDFISSEDPNSSWTSYHRIFDRTFYIGKNITDS
jgi:3'-5' exoribonuclease